MARIRQSVAEGSAAVQEAAEAAQNAANWITAILSAVEAGRQIQVKADIKRLMSGDWGGVEFRLKPDDGPPVNPNEQGQN